MAKKYRVIRVDPLGNVTNRFTVLGSDPRLFGEFTVSNGYYLYPEEGNALWLAWDHLRHALSYSWRALCNLITGQ